MFEINLSIGTGTDEIHSIPVGLETPLLTVGEIIRELSEIDLKGSSLYCQLEIAHNNLVCWSLYNPNTGVFEFWDGDKDKMEDLFLQEMIEIRQSLNSLIEVEIYDLEDIEGTVDFAKRFHLCTPSGERKIFSWDSEFIYTACGDYTHIKDALFRQVYIGDERLF